MKKILGIIVINILLICLSLFIIEGIIWTCENLRMKIYHEKYNGQWPLPFHPGVKQFTLNLDYFPNPEKDWGRNPVGLNYKNKPIVLFGDSFAYGFELKNEQTFYYKLSEATKRPVYVRAVPGWGIQHMLYQTRLDKFYEQVPEPEYAIFLMIHDHFRRLYTINFLSGHLLNEDRNLRYKLKDGKLVQITDSNILLRPIKKLYLTNKIHQMYLNNVILNPKNYDKYSEFAIEHFVESKNELQKHWKNTKYIVLLYQHINYEEDFMQKLRDKGFDVIPIFSLTDVNLSDKEYNIEEGYHPNEKAWDLLTPLIIKKLNLKTYKN